MTNTMEAAVGEISRVAAWSLRALGMKFGVADRAAPIVAWAEAVEGGALEALRTGDFHASGRPTGDCYIEVTPGHWKFDAAGRSLLEIGPAAIDLLTLAARTQSVGRVDFIGSIDPVFLSGLIRIGVKRNLGIVALSDGPRLVLGGRPVMSMHAFPGEHRPAFEESNLPQGGEVGAAISAWRGENASSSGRSSDFSLLAYHFLSAHNRDDPASSDDVEAKYAFALAHGVQVRPEDLTHLYQLEIKTWAPTSERSRKQALF